MKKSRNHNTVPLFVKLLSVVVVSLVTGLIIFHNLKQKEPSTPQGESVQKEGDKKQEAGEDNGENTQEKRGVWVSYLELERLLKGKSQKEFESELDKVFDNLKELNCNTLVFQVRPHGDALYPSKVYPWSYYVTGTQGKEPDFDPLKIVIEKAKREHIAVEAWVNPYRVKGSNTEWALCETNPAVKNKELTLEYQGAIYYDPSNEEVRKMVVAGVKELVENYEISAIQFDDYFYPTQEENYDIKQYKAYQKKGGTLSHKDFRREEVNKLIKEVYKTVKETNPAVAFGISPQGNNKNNYEVMCIDVEKWVTEEGYIDYIAPQLYWGFEHETAGFESKVKEWVNLVDHSKVKLYIGLGAYRIGEVEEGAGSGKKEWIEHTDILARQVKLLQETGEVKGFLFYRYDSLFGLETRAQNNLSKERENLKEQLAE